MRRWRTYACQDCGAVVRRRRESGQPLVCEEHSWERMTNAVRQLAAEGEARRAARRAERAAARPKPTTTPPTTA